MRKRPERIAFAYSIMRTFNWLGSWKLQQMQIQVPSAGIHSRFFWCSLGRVFRFSRLHLHDRAPPEQTANIIAIPTAARRQSLDSPFPLCQWANERERKRWFGVCAFHPSAFLPSDCTVSLARALWAWLLLIQNNTSPNLHFVLTTARESTLPFIKWKRKATVYQCVANCWESASEKYIKLFKLSWFYTSI